MKYLLALLLLPSYVSASQLSMTKNEDPRFCYTLDTKLKRETFSFNVLPTQKRGLRYCEVTQDYLDTLSETAQEFHKALHREVDRVLISCSIMLTDEERIALRQLIMGFDCLLQKNNRYAFELLQEAALTLDMGKVLLAYCYRYGIGTGKRETTAKILLDLGCDRVERQVIDKHLKEIRTEVRLGL